MKRLLNIIALAAACCLCSCIEGRVQYCDVYIQGGEELIDAQDYKINIPKDGSPVYVDMVGKDNEMTCSFPEKNSWLKVSKSGEPYGYENSDKMYGDWFVQRFSFAASENNKGIKRNEKVTIRVHAGNGFAAKLKVVQNK